MIHLRYKTDKKQRVNRKSSLSMHDTKGAMKNMRDAALALSKQDNWYSWRIVNDKNELQYGDVINPNHN